MSLGHSGVETHKIKEIISKKGAVVFLIGIGGVSMSAIARLLYEKGFTVFGCDREKTAETDNLSRMGITVLYGHKSENLALCTPDIVAYSLSVGEDCPEYLRARASGIVCVSRAELLGAIISLYEIPIGVCGSHGKSTVTAMLTRIFMTAGAEPTAMVGAPIANNSGYISGGNKYMIYEACEYRDSFLRFVPFCSVILNLELDHTDYFESIEQIKKSFAKAANLATGFVVLCVDDKNLADISVQVKTRIVTFGKRADADYKYFVKQRENGEYRFSVYRYGEFYSDFTLSLIGEHNVANATAAIAAAAELGIDKENIIRALASFCGIGRRLEKISELNEAPVYYDYAHHPTEIKATLTALKEEGYKNIAVVFCPHTYSRTAALWEDFCHALSGAGRAVITDIYAAREQPIADITAERLASDIPGGVYLPQNKIFDYIKKGSFDAIILMGAGNLDKTVRSFLDNKEN